MIKKFLVMIMISVLSISCVGCSGNPDTDADTNPGTDAGTNSGTDASINSSTNVNIEEMKREDLECADWLASELNTCITEYLMETDSFDSLGSVTVTWDENGATCDNTTFQDMIKRNVTTNTQSKVYGTYASAEIIYDENINEYSIEVKLGDAISIK